MTVYEIDPQNYRYLQDHVYSQSGIVLDQDKQYLVESRLGPLVRQLNLGSINDLCALLRATGSGEIGRQVAEAMTTNETYFFRDPAHYDAIRSVLLPRLKQERQQFRQMRFWSAASSTGQEAYSLAMALVEDGLEDWNVRIVGTDFSNEVLARARSGRYRQIEVNRGLPTPMLVKYFRRAGLDWEVHERLRAMVQFETIDLRESLAAWGPFDLVFCRNVLIYFDQATKTRILREIAGTLFRGGWLLLGGAETAFGVDEWFQREMVGGASVYIAR